MVFDLGCCGLSWVCSDLEWFHLTLLAYNFAFTPWIFQQSIIDVVKCAVRQPV